MKTSLTLMAAMMLAAVSTSCSNNNVEDGSASAAIDPSQIAFRSSVAKTRANDNALDQLKGGFNVIGLDQAGAYISGFADPAGDNVAYSFTTIWDWVDQVAKAQKVWPMDDSNYPLSFYAAYPLTTAVTKAAPSVNANVVSNLTPAAFAYNTYYNGNPIAFDASKVSVDELAAMTKVTRRPLTGFADLNFKHIMSNMNFKIEVPAGHEAYIHSIKIVNVNKSGRSYDYKTGTWSPEGAYAAANNAHFAHFIASAGQPVQTITNSAAVVNGLTDGASHYNTLKIMPQKSVTPWALGTVTTPAAGTFRADAAAWKASLSGNPVNAAAITKWHTQATAAQGMADSKGWEGARIEVIYCLVDKTGGAGKEKNVIGYKSGIDGAAQDLMIRVGYPLDIAAINAAGGWEAGKRYTFNIPLGTADASNGILLDPDFKTNEGANTDKPVTNPATEPGQEISKGGTIQFEVVVTNWENAPDVDIN